MSLEDPAVSVGRACRVVQLQRSAWYYRSSKDDQEVIDKLHQLAEKYPTRGLDEYYGMIRNEGLPWNRKRVLRVYRGLKLTLRRRRRRRVPERIKQPLEKQLEANSSYSMDFVSDALTTGRKIRVLNIMDDCTRESLAAHADYSIPSEKVIAVLDEILQQRGKPDQIRVDNGPEFTSRIFANWCNEKGITVKYIQPGKPMQNGYIEKAEQNLQRRCARCLPI